MRYFLKLAYNGDGFHGWQSQPNANSVQQTVEEALSLILRVPTRIVGAGRTDTGVNARVMYAHFDTETVIENKERFLLALNRLCGKNIALNSIIPVHNDAHARFDAASRTYKYFVTFEKSPFFYPLSWHSPTPLSLEKMNSAASYLLETDDFTSFAKLHSDSKTNICKVSEAVWEECDFAGVPGAVFTITADRFLRNMVRAVVGTLVDVGRGKISKFDFINIIKAKDRCSAGTSMPPQALFLWDIKYQYIKPNL